MQRQQLRLDKYFNNLGHCFIGLISNPSKLGAEPSSEK